MQTLGLLLVSRTFFIHNLLHIVSYCIILIFSQPFYFLLYESADEGSDARVEVNQRALIDKILARYASNNAVYRELLQNSNDA